MRIDRVYIKSFKNLIDFSLDLDESKLTNVFIGKNGTGKSNLLEALVIIFRDLDLQEQTEFSYDILYYCRQNKIEINSDVEGKSLSYSVNNKKISKKDFYNRSGAEYEFLPKHIFAYYSGPSNRLQKHFEKHQKRFYSELLKNNDKALRPLFYARLVHSYFVLLAFFSYCDQSSSEFLSKYLDITNVESILFVIKRPSWGKNQKVRFAKHEFWNARGVVREFLDDLYEYALAPLNEVISVEEGFSKSNTEVTYLYIKDEEQLLKFAQKYQSNSNFFKYLESTYLSDLILEIRIRVKKSDGTIITFNELSEGEQQLLTVLGLLKFTKEDESLFLLDEPDTHLNPAWKFEYLDLIKQVVGNNDNSQVIISTHDPIVIGGLRKEEVTIFKRDNSELTVKQPDFDPKGMGVAGLLTSELFGLSTTLDPETQRQLHRKRQLMYKSARTYEEETELNNLEQELGDMDYTKTVRDPLYEKFIKALFSRPEYQNSALTDKDLKKLESLTNEILSEILEEEKE